ncbi:MAG: hypothetical protein KDK99_20355 [Verrucomicrobiales bacterium]|nr:hypothetical protein [Verrucomicrobiales bacterium]
MKLPICLLLALSPALASPAANLPSGAPVGLKLQLVPEVSHIQPGTPFRAGLFLQHEPGYHTYWSTPGIVGVATALEWKLDAGWKASPLEFPEPERVLMFDIKAQGYERDVLLQCEITPPADLPVGQPITLTAKAVWMACARTCHPGVQDLHLTLPVSAAAPAADAQWAPIFAKERAARTGSTEAWRAEVSQRDATQVTLDFHPLSPNARALTPAEVAEVIFFTDDAWIHTDLPQTSELLADGTVRLHLPISDGYFGDQPTDLVGVLQLDGGWEKSGSGARSVRFRAALPPASAAEPEHDKAAPKS